MWRLAGAAAIPMNAVHENKVGTGTGERQVLAEGETAKDVKEVYWRQIGLVSRSRRAACAAASAVVG
jgi:hypothetical protein